MVHRENSRHQIQIHTICFRFRGFWPSTHSKRQFLIQCHIQLSNEGVMTLRTGNSCHILGNDFLCLMHFSFQHQPANLRKILPVCRIIAVHGQTIPQRIVIQRNALHIGLTVNHGSQPSVSQRQSILPHFRGTVIIHVICSFHLKPPFTLPPGTMVVIQCSS